MAHNRVTIWGVIAGFMWMPPCPAWKYIKESSDQYPHNALVSEGKSVPSDLRDMALRMTNDGDFQSCGFLADETSVIVERIKKTATGLVKRCREFPITFFPSIADCLVTDAEVIEAYETHGLDDE